MPFRHAAGAEPLVTFVVPSSGRPGLAKALASLQQQTVPEWRAVVSGDAACFALCRDNPPCGGVMIYDGILGAKCTNHYDSGALPDPCPDAPHGE
eukprot:gene37097-35351_t